MLARVAHEHLLKVGTADCQHNFVRLQQLPVAGNGHIDQVAPIVQVLKPGGNIIRKIVPTQRKLIHFGACSARALFTKFPLLLRNRYPFRLTKRVHSHTTQNIHETTRTRPLPAGNHLRLISFRRILSSAGARC